MSTVCDSQISLTISDTDGVYTKTLRIEWHSVMDYFCLDVSNHLSTNGLTKQTLMPDIAKMYGVLGWFAPAIIKVKILLQRLWESKVDWDEPVPEAFEDVWSKCLSRMHIPRLSTYVGNRISFIISHIPPKIGIMSEVSRIQLTVPHGDYTTKS